MKETSVVDVLFLILYLALIFVTWWRSRSIAWTMIMLTAAISVFGGVVNFVDDHLMFWNRLQLQWVLLVALLVPASVAFVRRPGQLTPRRHQIIAGLIPAVALAIFLWVMMTFLTPEPAYLNPVSFLMGHAVAEDNAKWLDFTAPLAAGGPIEQFVPMGGPLQLVLVFMATVMGVISRAAVGGYNEVLVAANTVVYGQYLMVVLAPLALAPLVEARFRRPTSQSSPTSVRIPWPIIWVGSTVLIIANLMLTAYGHLTLQYTIIVCTLWLAAFLAWLPIRRALLLTSLAVAVAMTVWLPLNVVAAVILIACFAILIVRGVRGGRGGLDLLGLSLLVIVTLSLWSPLRSSFAFFLSAPPVSQELPGGSGRGIQAIVSAASHVPFLNHVLAGLTDSSLFAAGGGTEQATALLAMLAAAAAVAAAAVIGRQRVGNQEYVRFAPALLLGGFAIALNVLDSWATGSAPHYGSYKFTFMVVIVLISACLPIAILLLDPAVSGMTPARWVGVGTVVLVLTVDTLLVRSIAAARPDQWNPPIPFNNPQSYWWPADVNGQASQPISSNPVACVYLPQGAAAPSAILDSQLSDPQRVYTCSRLLAGLAGQDRGAQPLVDWLRREWTTNTRAWSDVYGYLSEMPPAVLDRQVILLDDGSNVIGLESMRSLLQRFPASAGADK